jgi:hypothetical protein
MFTAMPRVPYVFSFSQFEAINNTEKIRDLLVSDSLFWPRLPAFTVRPTGGRGETVLFFTGAGGYGDQIMAWPVAKFLHDMGYRVHVLCDPGNDHLWGWFPWVAGVKVMPLSLAEMEEFDHLALYAYVTNVDEHEGQPHPTDHLFRMVGIDPSTIPPEKKRVPPPLSFGQLSVRAGAPENLGLIQLSGSNFVRRPMPDRLARMLTKLITEVPMNWLGLHDVDDEHMAAARKVAEEHPKLLQVRLNVSFDEFVGLTAAAKITVGPDSFLTHLRGSMGLPGVSVFGTHHPGIRTRYYPEMVSVWERQVCPSSPCLVFRRAFPRYLCPPSAGPRQECAVVAAGYDVVTDTVKKVLSGVKG